MEHQSRVQNQPHKSAGSFEPCHNYERLKRTIVYHTVTRICNENSIMRSGLGLDLSAELECSEGFSSCCKNLNLRKRHVGLSASGCES